jgi:hypothetical protein
MGMVTGERRHDLDFNNLTITIRGRELSVSQALSEGLLAHDEGSGLMRMGHRYIPHGVEAR